MTIEQLKKMKREGMIEYAMKEFGVGFAKYTGADVMVDQIMLQHEARDARDEAAKAAPTPAEIYAAGKVNLAKVGKIALEDAVKEVTGLTEVEGTKEVLLEQLGDALA